MYGCLYYFVGIVYYFIYSGDSDGMFVINSFFGVVMLILFLDYEILFLYRLIICVLDSDFIGGVWYIDFDL